MSRNSNYIPTLDGWRALSVIAVMLFHLPTIFIAGHSLQSAQSYGVFGVEVFFIISGFLICTRLLQEESQFGRISLANFYKRRLFRIQPAALFYLAILLLLWRSSIIHLTTKAWWASVFAWRNYYPKALWETPGAIYTNHFWSLSVEENFYLIIPLLLVFLPRSMRVKALAAVWFLSFCWGRLAQHWHLTDNRTDVAFELLMLPSLLALLLFNHQKLQAAVTKTKVAAVSLACLSFLSVSVRWLHGAATFPITQFLLITCVFGTALLPESLPSRILELAPFRFLGRMSYSLYLWQQLFCKAPDPTAASSSLLHLQHLPYNILATFVCALISYYLVEKPLIRVGHRLAPSPTAQGREVDQDVPTTAA